MATSSKVCGVGCKGCGEKSAKVGGGFDPEAKLGGCAEGYLVALGEGRITWLCGRGDGKLYVVGRERGRWGWGA